MKRLISLLIVGTMLLSVCFALSSCDTEVKAPEGSVTRVTVDVNPSVELMVDDQNKVSAVTALNDDGAIIIAGEVIIGKTPEEATKLILNIALDAGYIVSGNAEAGTNEIKISVSGDTKYQEKLSGSIKSEVEAFIDTEKLVAEYKEVEALAKAELEALALELSQKTKEDVKTLSETELYRLIEESRIETASLLTEELRDAYNEAKAYEIKYTERAEYAKIMEELGGMTAILQSSYKKALESYRSAVEEIEKFRYEQLVSPNSEYQKALVKMRDAKAEFLKERQYVASLDINGESYASAKLTLQASEEQYEAAYNLLVSIGDSVNISFDALLAGLASVETMLVTLEEQLFTENVLAEIDAHAEEIEAQLNTAKDNFFREFEAEHSADIDAYLAELEAKKEALIAANKTN